ncbi:hypothetical protein KC721_01100 [Candidatus Woesebacteria bacterium]|nr:hypothetical protein [Candidatus Woesebacteria bacterium]
MREISSGPFINQETVTAVLDHPDYSRYSELVDQVADLLSKKLDATSGFEEFTQAQETELNELTAELGKLSETIRNDTGCKDGELIAINNNRYQS